MTWQCIHMVMCRMIIGSPHGNRKLYIPDTFGAWSWSAGKGGVLADSKWPTENTCVGDPTQPVLVSQDGQVVWVN